MNHSTTNASISPTDSRPLIFSTTKMSRDITAAAASPMQNYQLSDGTIRTSHNVTDATVALTEKERPTYHSPNKMRALRETVPADPKPSTSSAYNGLSKSPPPHLETTASSDNEDVDAQDECLLFKLPPELRNAIYTYTIDRTDGQYGWIEDHDGPKLSLLNAKTCAPSNELLTTCRRIYAEGRGIFVQA
jgi:hypothetical protein